MTETVHTITVDGAGLSFPCAADDTILGAALRAGAGLAHECASGGCGSCKVELCSGDVDLLYSSSPGLRERDFAKGKRLGCMSRPVGDITIRFREAEEARPPVRPSRRKATLTARRAVTHDIMEFSFNSGTDENFLPGQFALLHLPGLPTPRAYSMANLPGGICRDFQIRRVPDGAATSYLFDAITPGTAITIDGPYGTAYYRSAANRSIVCIAGGSGLAPMISVARAALADPAFAGRHLDFYYGARALRDLFTPGDFGLDDPRVSFHPVLSAVEDEAWGGARGFVHDHLRESLGGSVSDREFYLAGPPPMVEATRRLLLLEQSVSANQVHYDRFF